MKDSFERALDALFQERAVQEYVATHRQRSRWQARMLRVANAADPIRQRSQARTEDLYLALYRDVQAGRGSAALHLRGEHAMDDIRSFKELIADAAERATVNVEPAWRLPLPSAPARVEVADATLLGDPDGAIADLQTRLRQALKDSDRGRTPALELRELRIDVCIDLVRVRTSEYFRHRYPATSLVVELALAEAQSPHVERVVRTARRVRDIDVADLLRILEERLALRRRAQPTPPDQYDLVLVEDARVPDRVSPLRAAPLRTLDGPNAAHNFGWLAPIVAHASSHWARRGLTRYQPGQSIHGIKPILGDPLTVVSDGTIPFAIRSRPVGELGAPIRRFAVVERGIAAGWALDQREAAVRGTAANGGIGNLLIAPGDTAPTELLLPTSRPLIQVLSLDWLDVDARSGAFVARVGVGRMTRPGRATLWQPVFGGIVRGNVFDLWANARFSASTDVAGWYHGPDQIRFNAVEIS